MDMGEKQRIKEQKMATYKEIQEYVEERYGQPIKTCWIAHVKEICGFHPKQAPNRLSPDERKYPCPDAIQPLIKDALGHFGMI
jgi:hypothetical protein